MEEAVQIFCMRALVVQTTLLYWEAVQVSSDGDASGYKGGFADSWLVKINAQNGNINWANCFGNKLTEAAFDLVKTNDGYVSVAAVDSGGFCCFETWDAQAIKIDLFHN